MLWEGRHQVVKWIPKHYLFCLFGVFTSSTSSQKVCFWIRDCARQCFKPVWYVRWWKWFMETGQIITVIGQINGCPCYYQSYTSKHPAPFLSQNTHTHSHAFSHKLLCCFFEIVKQNNSWYVWLTADFVSGICLSYPVKYWKLLVHMNPVELRIFLFSCFSVPFMLFSSVDFYSAFSPIVSPLSVAFVSWRRVLLSIQNGLNSSAGTALD